MSVGLVASCGRVGFDEPGPDAAGAGPTRLQWSRSFTSPGFARIYNVATAGQTSAFVVTHADDLLDRASGATVAGGSTGVRSFLLAVDEVGATRWSQPLVAENFCDIRSADLGGDELVLAGLTQGAVLGSGNPCDLGGAVQQPMLLRFGLDGAVRGTTTFTASGSNGANGQAWYARHTGGGDVVSAGIYGDALRVDGVDLPPGPTCCDATFVARSGATRWSHGLSDDQDLYPRGVELADDGDLCLAGRFIDDATILGRALVSAGGVDVWVARVDGLTGQARFVAAYGSAGDDDPAGVTASDTGCVIALTTPSAVVLGDRELPHAGGRDVAVLHVDGSGVRASQVLGGPGVEQGSGLSRDGATRYLLVSFDSPIRIGGTDLTPRGPGDALLIALDDTSARVVDHLRSDAAIVAGLSGNGPALGLTGVFAAAVTSERGLAVDAGDGVFAVVYALD
ncbi:MAG: hypothetical protein KBG28_00440 [Kofleriaceae bacterium]|nr:hypothetical protein [Kofleriaceae bacterium]